MKLTNNFSLKELTQSQTALRNGLDNTPDEQQIDNLQNICEKILQPLREFYNLPVKVTSGFRSEQLATMIGSKPTSQHCKGEAVDFEIPSVDNKEVATKIKDEFIFDQLILEYYTGEANSGWIHVSFHEGNNRKQVLTFDGKRYTEGLPEMKWSGGKVVN